MDPKEAIEKLSHGELVVSTVLMATSELNRSKEPCGKDHVVDVAVDYGRSIGVTRAEIETALDKTLWDLLTDAPGPEEPNVPKPQGPIG